MVLGWLKVALLSDVHANLPALQEVLREVHRRGAEVILHAGDVLGYNPFPDDVVEAFRGEGVRSILGNHDRAVLSGDTSWFNAQAAAAIQWTRRVAAEATRRYLEGLGTRMETSVGPRSLLMVHGSPRDDDEYLYEDDVGDGIFEAVGAEVLVLGHTHVPYVVKRGNRLVVNPGSVGQPRDGDPRASFALLDPETVVAKIVRVEYDVEEVVRAVLRAGLPPFLAHRLKLGR
jgi:putative phosphoesterase